MTWVILTLYSATVVYWMFIGFGREAGTGGPLHYNLVPLKTIKLFFNLENGLTLGSRLVNLLGNVAVFVPFGILLPLLKPRLQSVFRIAVAVVPSILLLETLQMLLRVGSFDIDDLLLNMLGVWTGCFLLQAGRRIRRR
ncbi:VanZ family protein [Paenibacillus albidus]|uniref:VanZ family protein n=1 Tax=Paenibacillus albidus TaxID=2041023 RepID=UPI001BE6BE28|nr:VanZ family protein [Paenibacillus albidus]MBT2291673.1 VanZ family protein [Paenibacillus albidus]